MTSTQKAWQARNEAFGGGRHSHDWTLEEWGRIRFDDPEFDPSLRASAWDGEEVGIFR